MMSEVLKQSCLTEWQTTAMHRRRIEYSEKLEHYNELFDLEYKLGYVFEWWNHEEAAPHYIRTFAAQAMMEAYDYALMMHYEIESMNHLMSQLGQDYMKDEEQRSDHCPYCGAYWEDGHYDECPMILANEATRHDENDIRAFLDDIDREEFYESPDIYPGEEFFDDTTEGYDE